MSYDIELRDAVTDKVLESEFAHEMTGGTYQMGSTKELWLNVTYNYGRIYRELKAFKGDGIWFIDGVSGAESIPALQQAVLALGDDVDDDYWKPTEGNAKKALVQLLAMARLRPDGIWRIG